MINLIAMTWLNIDYVGFFNEGSKLLEKYIELYVNPKFRSVFEDQPDPDNLCICAPLSSKPSRKLFILRYFFSVFIPGYNVSVDELVIPESDLSQHISTADMRHQGSKA
ncbi:hypothetical protein L1987_01510 [Smallanthus sonchifolius]|uniref:Uncharacterized protein n=1 Tax=Smallanthus sonchifolius TaxID=185202 RepID=A0ACB9K5I2_9ASTR|nr:hypothetical protein L1987_01510 [Smallanthus sonchifolius]